MMRQWKKLSSLRRGRVFWISMSNSFSGFFKALAAYARVPTAIDPSRRPECLYRM
jgi:hypothetical protein